ncbi:MAG: hypothetical protein P9L99_02965 [Candidatus Lernaella stagnicola]|nr:hypothetical protein [Candidatus Lernaella stagnicola]
MRKSVWLVFLALAAVGCLKAVDYDRITEKNGIDLPRDHYAHDDFRSEWWY